MTHATGNHKRTNSGLRRGASGKRTPRFDVIDLRIIRELQASSKITNAALAARVGISAPSTLERVRRLEESGVIRGYVALLDPAAVNLTVQAIAHVSLSSHTSESLRKAKEALAKFDEIQACWHTAGDEDFVLKVIVADMHQYERFISEKLSTVPNIGKIRTAFVLSNVKETTQVPVGDHTSHHATATSSTKRRKRSSSAR